MKGKQKSKWSYIFVQYGKGSFIVFILKSKSNMIIFNTIKVDGISKWNTI